MEIIRYEFCDGTVSEVQVSNELYVIYEELVRQEKRNHWRNTRRHVSLDYLNQHDIGIEAPFSDPLSILIRQEENAEHEQVLAVLSEKQRELLETVYIDGKTMADIARTEGVDSSSVRHRMMRVINKLKKF